MHLRHVTHHTLPNQLPITSGGKVLLGRRQLVKLENEARPLGQLRSYLRTSSFPEHRVIQVRSTLLLYPITAIGHRIEVSSVVGGKGILVDHSIDCS